jgi:acetolactate synthase regulatory subunit
MRRVNLYIKVEIELEEDEKAERVAAELCRQLEKLYPVRSAELSSITARE